MTRIGKTGDLHPEKDTKVTTNPWKKASEFSVTCQFLPVIRSTGKSSCSTTNRGTEGKQFLMGIYAFFLGFWYRGPLKLLTPNDILQVCCTCLIITATCVYVPHDSRGFDVPQSSALVIFMAKHISQYVCIYSIHMYIDSASQTCAWEYSSGSFCGCRYVIANFVMRYVWEMGKGKEFPSLRVSSAGYGHRVGLGALTSSLAVAKQSARLETLKFTIATAQMCHMWLCLLTTKIMETCCKKV